MGIDSPTNAPSAAVAFSAQPHAARCPIVSPAVSPGHHAIRSAILRSLEIIGTLVGVLVGSVLAWLQATHSRHDDRRRDAWAAWAEHAYRLMITRRELVERCWLDRNAARDADDRVDPHLAQSIAAGLRRAVERDPPLHSALARVLLAETSATRRKQAREFTDLLSGDVDEPHGRALEFLRSHELYIAALQATLDDLLGAYAESTIVRVRSWFKERYAALASTDKP
jgi:hypothetical protein